MDFALADKTAMVMAASAGLGKAVARALTDEGCRVAICARPGARLEATAAELGAEAIAVDLTEPGAGAQLIQTAVERLGSVDILVTNAGGPPRGDFMSVSNAMWQASFQSLWLAAVDAIRAALPGMRERSWGRVLMITSGTCKEPIADLTISNALRPGLMALANSLSREVAADGVTVNVVMPGSINTERLAELGIDKAKAARAIPAGRLGAPEEFAAMCAFLASDPARYITGQALACDGGRLMGI